MINSIPFEPGDSCSSIPMESPKPGVLRRVLRGRALAGVYKVNGHFGTAALVEGIRKAVFGFSDPRGYSDDLTSVAIKVEERQAPLMRQEIDLRSDLRNYPGLVIRANFLLESSRRAVGRRGVAALDCGQRGGQHIMSTPTTAFDQSITSKGEAFFGSCHDSWHHFGVPFGPFYRVRRRRWMARADSGFGAYIIAGSVDEYGTIADERGRNCMLWGKIRKAKEK